MKAIICQETNKMAYQNIEMPQIDHSKDEVILRITAVGVCGSDIHTHKGGNPLFEYPKVLGHEIAAVVHAVSDAQKSDLVIGDLVTIMPYKYCGVCQACRMGKENCCASLEVLGVHINGGMTEYLKIESTYVIKIDSKMKAEQIAMIEPLSISEHAVARGNIVEQDILLVIGAGMIGIGAALMARLRTQKVIIMDTNEERLNFCREVLGFSNTINALEDAEKKLLEITGGLYATAVIDATGSESSMNAAVNYLCNGGRLVFVGIHKTNICINDMSFHKRETSLYASRAAFRCDFEYVIENIENGKIDPSLLISHESTFDGFIEAFETWLLPESKLIKGLLKVGN